MLGITVTKGNTHAYLGPCGRCRLCRSWRPHPCRSRGHHRAPACGRLAAAPASTSLQPYSGSLGSALPPAIPAPTHSLTRLWQSPIYTTSLAPGDCCGTASPQTEMMQITGLATRHRTQAGIGRVCEQARSMRLTGNAKHAQHLSIQVLKALSEAAAISQG